MYLFIGGIFGLAALLDTYCKCLNSFQRAYLYFVFCFVLFLIVGFRGSGFDYDNYLYYYKVLQSNFWIQNAQVLGIEKGYAFLNYMSCSYRQVLVTMAFITLSLYSYFIYKYSPIPFMSLFLLLGTYIYPFAMGQYRQALAVGLIAFASLLKERKLLFFGVLVIASLFHVSALLGVLLLFLSNKLYDRKVYVYLLLISLICNISLKTFFMNSLNLFPAFVGQKLAFYTDNEMDKSFGLNFAMLLRLFIFTYFWKNRSCLEKYKKGYYFLNIYYLSLLIYLGLGFLPQLSGRGSIYFYFFELILIPMYLSEKRTNYLPFIFFMLIYTYRQFSFFDEWGAEYIPNYSDLIMCFGL